MEKNYKLSDILKYIRKYTFHILDIKTQPLEFPY